MNYVTSCVSTQSAGVITLFDNSCTCHEGHKDNNGRLVIAVIDNDNEKLNIDILYILIQFQYVYLVLSCL